MANYIDRQTAIDALDGEITITGRVNAEAVKGYVKLVKDRLERLPSAQPEIKPKGTKLSTVCLLCKKPAVTFNTEDDIPYTNYSYCEECLRKGLKLLRAHLEVQLIGYQDCANAMLRMWMDNIITDGEYNRIMDKLNAHWKR